MEGNGCLPPKNNGSCHKEQFNQKYMYYSPATNTYVFSTLLEISYGIIVQVWAKVEWSFLLEYLPNCSTFHHSREWMQVFED